MIYNEETWKCAIQLNCHVSVFPHAVCVSIYFRQIFLYLNVEM